VVRGASPPEPRVLLDPSGLRSRRDGALLLELIGRIILHTANTTAWEVLKFLKQVRVGIAPIKDGEPAWLH
jgi:hypothetical protein